MDITQYMTVAAAAVELGVSRPRVWQIIKAGKLAIRHRLGRTPLVSKADVGALAPQIRGKAGRPAKPRPARKPRKEKDR
jgi:excisionase family DNA binding protein